ARYKAIAPRMRRVAWNQPVDLAGGKCARRPGIKRDESHGLEVAQIILRLASDKYLGAERIAVGLTGLGTRRISDHRRKDHERHRASVRGVHPVPALRPVV